MSLVNLTAFSGQKIHNTSDKKWELGSIAVCRDHVFRYIKASAAIAAGNLVVTTDIAQVTNITGLSNAGDRNTNSYPYIEDSGESMTVNYYEDFYVYLSGNTGVGQIKKVHRNTATRLYLKAVYPELGEADTFDPSPDTTTDYNLISPWFCEKAEASDKIQTVIGYAYAAITQHRYGWVICGGVGNPSSGTASAGVIDTCYGAGDDTAGQGSCAKAGTDDIGDFTPCGVALYAGADDTKWPVLFRGIAL